MPSEDVIQATILFTIFGISLLISWVKCIIEWWINKSTKSNQGFMNKYLLVFPIIAAIASLFCGILSYRNPQQLIEYVPVWNEITTIGCGIFLGSIISITFCLGNYTLSNAINTIKCNNLSAGIRDIILALLLISLSIGIPIIVASIYIPELTIVGDIILSSATVIFHTIVIIPGFK